MIRLILTADWTAPDGTEHKPGEILDLPDDHFLREEHYGLTGRYRVFLPGVDDQPAAATKRRPAAPPSQAPATDTAITDTP